MTVKWIGLGALALAAQVAWATPVINVDQNTLQPNQQHQTVDIYVSGGDAVAGLNLYVQLGNGTDSLAAPTIETIDITSAGLVFSGNNTGARLLDSYPHEVGVLTTTFSGTVAASGKLATIYIDTTGYSSGTWDLILGEYTAQGIDDFDKRASDFGGTPISIADGSITVSVPEPTSGMLLLGAGIGAVAARRRRA
jgi:hypothetical protein